MNYETRDCIDAGTEYCPCNLAETGDCILCSQLSGKTFCDCVNWKGVCIYQEYIWNGSKAKPGRKSYSCKILNKELHGEKIMILTILAPQRLVKELSHAGSYVFLRDPKKPSFYEAPISIMEANIEENWVKVAIEIKGVKTKTINSLKEDEKILLRGPFWNGDFGLKNIDKSKEGTCILIARGIGAAPLVPVLQKLYGNGNRIIAIIDKSPYKDIFIKDYLEMCNSEIIEYNTLEQGELSEPLKEYLRNIMKTENVNLVHCSGPDILIYKLLDFLGDNVAFSCCNNAKMCCGEGVCGTCSTRFKNHNVKKLCKYQIEPKYVFEGRRFI